MTTVYIRDVSEETLTVLKVRAAQARQSLQAYMRDLIEREAALPTLEEAAARAADIARLNASSGPITNDDVLAAIDEGRRGR
ncbi:FitA-like ribbon-helix-helix domain-containing protein [Yinghuangia seranimata]|uniref:FitA-like ribbon-helix-helix domain-containing protein n=1 Tax=Yinghuangia seranimata TaxID=408067 RepID=UPI00248C8A20|nr:antitoxin [Yinghuangia seranimata]MDI2127249.1 antitoxin [Yinghuangia seranimata]MDI2132194.1 antitoxin [Yinghuangia seranimata]